MLHLRRAANSGKNIKADVLQFWFRGVYYRRRRVSGFRHHGHLDRAAQGRDEEAAEVPHHVRQREPALLPRPVPLRAGHRRGRGGHASAR